MKTTKMSLANIKEKLSRAEMKKIMAGSSVESYGTCCKDGDCGGLGCTYWITCNYTFTKC